MERFQPNQKRVFDEARQRLKNKFWFKGICLDNFPEEQECLNNFEDSVEAVIFETSLWDDPSCI